MFNFLKRKNYLKIQRLSDTAKLPTKAYDLDAGFDLYSDEERDIYLHDQAHCIIRTGISMEIPKGWFGMIKPRSGLSADYGVDVLAGVVDSAFRGEVKVILNKCKNENLVIQRGMKIAQMVILPVPELIIKEVNKLSESKRGIKGFGSSGR